MRDRLIELLQNAPSDYAGNRGVGAIADYLIANNVFVLPNELENNLELTAKFLMGLFLNSEEEIEKTKEIFEFSQTKKILTDIRDYLLQRKAECGNKKCEINQIMDLGVEVFVDKAIADLTEYAEKLGVEL